MNNDQLLEKMRGIVREEIQAETKPLKQGQAQITTVVEALAAGQQDLREKVGGLQAGQQAIRKAMATKADMQDLDAKLVKRVNSHEKRIDDLEKEAGLPNPHKN
jgi:hypothetical protein